MQVSKSLPTRVRAAQLTLLLTLATAGCENSNNPTSPSSLAQVGGDWTYTLRLNSVSGGECVGNIMQEVVGMSDMGTLNIVQTGSALSATIGDVTTGTCTYTGSVSGDSITLNLSRCDGGLLLRGFECRNGAVRDIEFASNIITASVTGNNAQGSSVETYNIYAASTTNRLSVMTANASFSATRR